LEDTLRHVIGGALVYYFMNFWWERLVLRSLTRIYSSVDTFLFFIITFPCQISFGNVDWFVTFISSVQHTWNYYF